MRYGGGTGRALGPLQDSVEKELLLMASAPSRGSCCGGWSGRRNLAHIREREREILGIVPCPRRSAIQRLPAPTREAKRDPEVPKSVPGTGRDDEKRKGNSAGSRWRTGCLSPHPLPIAPP